GDLDVYTFAAAIGDSVSVAMGKTGSDPYGNLHPHLELYGPNGALVATTTGAAEYSTAALIGARTLTQPGTYYVVARDAYGGGAGISYNLTVAHLGPNAPQVPVGDAGPVTTLFPYPTLFRSGDLDVYTFAAAIGDSVSV